MTITVAKYVVDVDRDPINGMWAGKVRAYEQQFPACDSRAALRAEIKKFLRFMRKGTDWVPPDAPPRQRRGRAQKRRGYQCEKLMEGRLTNYGFKRVPLSGALGGKLSGDLRRDHEVRRAIEVVEVKRRQGKQSTLRRWLGQGGAHLVLIDTGGGAEPIAVLELKTLEAVLGEAGY